MNKENCALKFVDEIILYYDARSKIHKKTHITFAIKYNGFSQYTGKPRNQYT